MVGFALSAAVLGLSAGLFEESARYLVLRFWQRRARSWREALMFGAGHGGIESIALGAIVLLTLSQMVAYRGVDLSTVFSADELQLAQRQLDVYWAAPAPYALLGALERATALCLHLSASVMVMRALTDSNRWWLAAAIGWHALIDAAAVFSLPLLGAVATEAIIGVMALISLAIIFRLRQEAPPVPPVTADRPLAAPKREGPVAAGPRSIDESRYTDS